MIEVESEMEGGVSITMEGFFAGFDTANQRDRGGRGRRKVVGDSFTETRLSIWVNGCQTSGGMNDLKIFAFKIK